NGTLYTSTNGTSWSVFASGLDNAYHSVMLYSRIHRAMFFGGGSPSGLCYMLPMTGAVVTIPCPAGGCWNAPISEMWEERVPGDPITLDNVGNFGSFNPGTGAWTAITGTSIPTDCVSSDTITNTDHFNCLASTITNTATKIYDVSFHT